MSEPCQRIRARRGDKARDLKLAGILYPSRHKIDATCLALFDVGTDIVEGVYGTLDDDQYLEILEDEFKWGLI